MYEIVSVKNPKYNIHKYKELPNTSGIDVTAVLGEVGYVEKEVNGETVTEKFYKSYKDVPMTLDLIEHAVFVNQILAGDCGEIEPLSAERIASYELRVIDNQLTELDAKVARAMEGFVLSSGDDYQKDILKQKAELLKQRKVYNKNTRLRLQELLDA